MYYLVDEEDMKDLVKSALELTALRAGGVDNWEWCGESIGDFIAECSERDNEEYEDLEEIVKNVLSTYIKVQPGDVVE